MHKFLPSDCLQATLPASLLCFDLLTLFSKRGDGRFVLREIWIKAENNSQTFKYLKLKKNKPKNLHSNPDTLKNKSQLSPEL